MNYLMSIILGLIPEVLYFTLFLIYTKNIKEKKFRLFGLMAIAYFIFLLLNQKNLYCYLIFMVCTYLALKLLYRNKVQIIDIFIVEIPSLFLTMISAIMYFFLQKDMSNYWILYFICRICMFIPFIWRKHFNKLYKIYCKLWNRNDAEKRPIKSITLRNISLISFNILIMILNVVILRIK